MHGCDPPVHQPQRAEPVSDAAAILAAPHGVQADLQLVRADLQFARAVVALHRSDWLAAATDAVAGYDDMQRADAAAGVTPASQLLGKASAAGAVGQDRQLTPDARITPETLHLWLPPAGTTQAPVAPTVSPLTGPAT